MISDGFSVWSFIVSRLASSSITKKVPESYLRHFLLLAHISPFWRTYESNDNGGTPSSLVIQAINKSASRSLSTPGAIS
jgi:hypothetical protein